MNAPNYQASEQATYQDRTAGRYADPTIDQAAWLDAITAASSAPSVHNTQPWRFMVRPDAVGLHLDEQRVLPVADPTGRQARISCGAALLNLCLTLRANGVEPAVALLPQRAHPTLLAIVRPAGRRPATPTEIQLNRAIPRRHSHRHPFHAAPVPQAALRSIVYAAGLEGGYLRLVIDTATLGTIAALVRRAENHQRQDEAYQAELAAWTFSTGARLDGVPQAASGPRPEPGDLVTLRDFAPDTDRPTRHFESDPLLGVLMSAGDTPLDQLRCGQALQRALLTATDLGIAATIMSAPTELRSARAALRREVGGAMWPQLVLRFGSGLSTMATPRRPVSDIAELGTGDHQAGL
ncbi:MAG TPA: nitroreductase [Pseudonocardiaceae bacterium]